MAAKRCPKCGLVNTATATTCDCGWSFENMQMTDARRYRPGDSPAERTRGWITTGVLFAVGFVVLGLGRVVGAGQLETGVVISSIGGVMMLIAAISAVLKIVRLMSR